MSRTGKFVFSFAAAAFLLLTGLFSGGKTVLMAKADESASSCRYRYTSVKILENDTLESFAARYNRGLYETDEAYMECIRRINGMHGEQLHTGCYLTLVSRTN